MGLAISKGEDSMNISRDISRRTAGKPVTPTPHGAMNCSDAGADRDNNDAAVQIWGQLLPGILGQAVGNHTGLNWMSTDHTSDYVLLTALGPGRPRRV